jgi:SulP family sulfate permease
MSGGEWLSGWPLYAMLMLVALTMAIIWLLPKITTAIPAPLAGIGIVALVVILFDIDVPRVGDMASIEGGLPSFHIPQVPLNFETLQIILPYALVLAAIGLIESLLTLNLVGRITGGRGGASQECVAQGMANTVTGFFGGMGGCAMIGQSMINVRSGGRRRISGIAAALFLLSFILVASPLIEQIPLAALVGVMFMVVIGTFAWNTFRIMWVTPPHAVFVMLLVTVVTVLEDLAVAVVVGVIASALRFAWENARRIEARTEISPEGDKIYHIEGPLFFGSAAGFSEVFDPAGDPDKIVVDFAESRVVDQSALNAIESLSAEYKQRGKSIRLRHLSRDCYRLLSRPGLLFDEADDDPDYQIATNYSVRTGVFSEGH